MMTGAAWRYLNPGNYARRASRLANHHVVRHVETMLAPDSELALRHPPIFFLGAPRSGSTLAVQVITDVLDVGYISNRHCQWFGAPALAEKLFHPTRQRPTSNYKSRHGEIDGWHAPAECGEWWYRFFRREPAYVTLDEIDPHSMKRFRQSVAALTDAFDRPIIFKNLYASLRIQAIAHYLPESLFIVIHRNEVGNGHSLLEARKHVYGDYKKWWSMEPPGVEQLKCLPPHEQVIEQIRHIHSAIVKDLRVSGAATSRTLHLNYEDFCSDPLATIKDIQLFASSHGCEIEQRNTPPERFKMRNHVRIDPNLYREMSDYARSN